jgi:cytochrome c biogenesis protein CcmG, thiol:disulfide interchange protein DsbE
LNKLKRYSFYFWLIAIVAIFLGANKIYKDYTTKQIIERSFGSVPEVVNTPSTGEDLNNNGEKPAKNSEGMPLVPDFTLKDENGIEYSLSDYSGKVVIINFWASWCPPCRREMPEFQKLNDEVKTSEDVVLLMINLTDGQRETKDRALKYLSDGNYDFNTVLLDPEYIASNIFGIQSIPTTAIIDRDGYLHDYIMGETTKNSVLRSVERVR